jgi:hypothetical protein
MLFAKLGKISRSYETAYFSKIPKQISIFKKNLFAELAGNSLDNLKEE